MRLVKVYDAKGNHVDSFLKDVTKASYSFTSTTFAQKIRFLNSKGFYIRGQFSKSGKTLMRSYS